MYLALVACSAGTDVPVDTAEPAACMPGLASVEVCVDEARRYEVFLNPRSGSQSVQTLIDGPGCTVVHAEPGDWTVSVSYPDCVAWTDVTLDAACDTARMAFEAGAFSCGLDG
jgi:hypothetical protein